MPLSNGPEFLELLKVDMVPPPVNPDITGFNFNEPVWKKLTDYFKVQEQIKQVYDGQPPGTFVEVGAADGYFMSQTLYLEKNLSWTGLLIEPDPRAFGTMVARMRNAWLSPHCVDIANIGKRFWMRKLEPELPQYFQDIMRARSRLYEEILIGGWSIRNFTTKRMAAAILRVSQLGSIMSDSEEEKKTEGPAENLWALKLPVFKKGDMKYHLQEESSFSVLFPKYREKYVSTCFPIAQAALKKYGIDAELDLIKGSMTVQTTRNTWDPYIILKARGVISLISRSVPVEQAVKVLKDDITYEIIRIKAMVRSKERFIKRRQRLIGANGTTLKAMELLTECYILIQGGTVAVIGPYRGIPQVISVVKDTMNNIHPVYSLKSLMIKRQLVQDSKLKNEDWSRFIPKLKKTAVPHQKPKKKKKKEKKPYTPFPPPQTESKFDKMLAEGKYFVDQAKNSRKSNFEERKRKSIEIQKTKRARAFIPPEES